MTTLRIALANLEIPKSPEDALSSALAAIADAARMQARIVCFPEAYIPGYPWPTRKYAPVDGRFLDEAHWRVAQAAADNHIGVVLGTERIVAGRRRLTALVVQPDGEVAGYQDKVQLDPSEEEDGRYEPGDARQIYEISGVRFGVVICHEGFRYPETSRWAARRGAQLIFHPFYDEAVPGAFQPSVFADPRNTFHEKALLCRAAENSCFFAAVNCASAGSPTTSAVVGPDGVLLSYQPYGQPGLLVYDVDPAQATGLFARRFRGDTAVQGNGYR